MCSLDPPVFVVFIEQLAQLDRIKRSDKETCELGGCLLPGDFGIILIIQVTCNVRSHFELNFKNGPMCA